MERTGSGKLTPEKVVKILEKKGTIVTVEEAEKILNFIKTIANITVNQYLSKRI